MSNNVITLLCSVILTGVLRSEHLCPLACSLLFRLALEDTSMELMNSDLPTKIYDSGILRLTFGASEHCFYLLSLNI